MYRVRQRSPTHRQLPDELQPQQVQGTHRQASLCTLYTRTTTEYSFFIIILFYSMPKLRQPQASTQGFYLCFLQPPPPATARGEFRGRSVMAAQCDVTIAASPSHKREFKPLGSHKFSLFFTVVTTGNEVSYLS